MRTIGASVAGPAHLAAKRPNEDAWRARVSSEGAWAVVCDGLGSRPQGGPGARAAVSAAGQAWRKWSRSRTADPADFARLVEVLWRLELNGTKPDEASTTVIFAGLRPNGSGLCAQLGDGLLGLRLGSKWRSLSPERTSFGSVTNALGTPHSLKDWTLYPLEEFPKGASLLLTSDGIADDLERGREGDLVDWLVSEFASVPRGAARLSAALRSWPVPHHRDDKTLVLLWNPTEA